MYAELINDAIAAYFGRVKSAQATPDEIQILPEMLKQFAGVMTTSLKSENADDIPSEGLLTAEQTCKLIGRPRVKQPSAYLIRQVRAKKLPAPWLWQKPYRWLKQDIENFVMNGGETK